MTALLDVYRGTLPGDMDDMISRRQRHPELYQSHPVLMLVACALKYGPARDALEVVVRRALPSARQPSPPPDWTARRLYDILTQTAVALANVNMSTWVQNCGHGVARPSGFLPWLQRQGVLTKCGPDSPAGQRRPNLSLGQQGMNYQAALFTESVAARMGALLRASSAIKTCQLRPCGP